MSNFEQAGADFQKTLIEFANKSDKLRKNELHRVTKALAAYPLEEGVITLVHDTEKEVYELGTTIQSIKMTLMVESLKQDAEAERIQTAQNNRAQNKEGSNE